MAKSVVSHVRICYPLPGGSALVTFDDPNGELQEAQGGRLGGFLGPILLPFPSGQAGAAAKGASDQCGRVPAEGSSPAPGATHADHHPGYRVAGPWALQGAPCTGHKGIGLCLGPLPPVFPQVSSQMNDHRVLVSGFPAGLKLSEEELLDKLEIFFGKTKNGGGDVEMRELLQGGVMLGFTEAGGKGLAGGMRSGASGHGKGEPWMLKVSCSVPAVAQHLCQMGQFMVPLGKKQSCLRVSPYMSGKIQKAEVSGKMRMATGPGHLPACQKLAQGGNHCPQTPLTYSLPTSPGLLPPPILPGSPPAPTSAPSQAQPA